MKKKKTLNRMPLDTGAAKEEPQEHNTVQVTYTEPSRAYNTKRKRGERGTRKRRATQKEKEER